MRRRSLIVACLAFAASGGLGCSSKGTRLASDAGARADVEGPIPEGGVPYLMDLSVSSSSEALIEGCEGGPPSDGGTVELVPPFSPSTYDYYVRCPAAVNDLTVSMKASPGASSVLSQPADSGGSAPQQTLSVTVNENQAIVAVATDGTASTEYWVRCLPNTFPQMQMVTHPEAGTPPPGYYLVGNLHVPCGEMGYAMVLNGNGVPVWYYQESGGQGVCDVENLMTETISFLPTAAGIADMDTNPFELHELSPLATKHAAPSGISIDEHEFRVLPNGDFLVFSDPIETGFDFTGVQISHDGVPETLGSDTTISDCEIVEFEPTTGHVTWKWFASQHFDPAADCTFPQFAVVPGSAQVIDPFHCNAIDVDPANGNLLVSSRDTDSVFYIEKLTGRVLWKMGGANTSKDGAAYVSVPDAFYRQHDARLQPGWSSACNGGTGQISMFDDQTLMAGPARAVVYDVVVGESIATGDGGAVVDGGASADAKAAGDAAACGNHGTVGVATVAWQYPGASTVNATGSFRISPDGSRVIGWGNGTTDLYLAFTEVDIDKNDLLDFSFTDFNTSYRAVKVPLDALDLGIMRSVTGLPSP